MKRYKNHYFHLMMWGKKRKKKSIPSSEMHCCFVSVLKRLLFNGVSWYLCIWTNSHIQMCSLVICAQVFRMHSAINNNNLYPSCLNLPPSPHLLSFFLSPLGNSDSGKWDSWFEGETSACGRSAGFWRGSEWNKRMYTGKNEWIDGRMEFLMFIDAWVRWSWKY